MNITLNNRTEYFDKESLTVQELLDIKNFTFKMLIIKLNGRLIKKHSIFNIKPHNTIDAVAD